MLPSSTGNRQGERLGFGLPLPWGPLALLTGLALLVLWGRPFDRFGQRGLPAAPERSVRVGYVPIDRPGAPLEFLGPLMPGRSYYFAVELGLPIDLPEETAVAPTLIEAERARRLTVGVFAYDGEINIPGGAALGEFELQLDGEALVSQPSARPEVPFAGQARRLLFSVRAPERPGPARLRCNIYSQGTLVRSQLIRGPVGGSPSLATRLRALIDLLRSRTFGRPDRRLLVDYRLSRSLDVRHLAHLAPHRLSLLVNESGHDSHVFTLHSTEGGALHAHGATFQGTELQKIIERARGALRQVAWGDDQLWQRGKSDRYEKLRSADELAQDLFGLAIAGRKLYQQVGSRLVGKDADEAWAVFDLMVRPCRVQIALAESARDVLPAALFYDYELDEGATTYQLCAQFHAALHESSRLEESPCFQGDCPQAHPGTSDPTVVCPSGFWGFRHFLGQPLSTSRAPGPPLRLRYAPPPALTVAVSTDESLILRESHLESLVHLFPALDRIESREDVINRLKNSRPHAVYFYCHGGGDSSEAYLRVGPAGGPKITPGNLWWRSAHRWVDPRPLIFVNGCRTTALTPDAGLEFVTAFIEWVGASGVIGTEITIFEPLASTFGATCLAGFLREEREIGDAVRAARLAVLEQGNPLGLVYTPFVIASLQLERVRADAFPST